MKHYIIAVLVLLSLSVFAEGSLLFNETFDNPDYAVNGWLKSNLTGYQGEPNISNSRYSTALNDSFTEASLLYNPSLSYMVNWSDNWNIRINTYLGEYSPNNYFIILLADNMTNEEPNTDYLVVLLSEDIYSDGTHYVFFGASGGCSVDNTDIYPVGNLTYREAGYNLSFNGSVLSLFMNDTLIESANLTCSDMESKVFGVSPRWTEEYIEDITINDDYIQLCFPDWVCSLANPCRMNDTASCNETTDLNSCGDAYTGDYSEFGDYQCDYCSQLMVNLTNNVCVMNIRNLTIYDTNFNTCCNMTNLSSDCIYDGFSEFPGSGIISTLENCEMPPTTIELGSSVMMIFILIVSVALLIIGVAYAMPVFVLISGLMFFTSAGFIAESPFIKILLGMIGFVIVMTFAMMEYDRFN